MSYGVGQRRGSDPELLWQWCRLASVAPIRPLAWETPYAAGAALKRQKTEEKKNQKNTNSKRYAPQCSQQYYLQLLR